MEAVEVTAWSKAGKCFKTGHYTPHSNMAARVSGDLPMTAEMLRASVVACLRPLSHLFADSLEGRFHRQYNQ